MKTLAWAGGFVCSLYVGQIVMHLLNMDGTAGLADISGKEITKEHVESGRVGADIIYHVSAREGMMHFTILMLLLNISWSGYAKQKVIALGIYLAFYGSKVLLKFLVPWNGESPTDVFDFGMPLNAFHQMMLHPVFLILIGAYLDDDIYEFFGGEPEKEEKTD
jgi:hypothetical protein